MNLKQLAEPFPAADISWRVSRSGMGKRGVWANVFCYITSRAVYERLDEVCGPENWKTEPLTCHEIRPGMYAMQVGLSIRINDEWVTRYDVAEPTGIEDAKGGFSGASKRAGSQWGIGRYLRRLKESFAEVSQTDEGRGWNYARLSDKQGGAEYYWKPPALPGWALPKEFQIDDKSGLSNLAVTTHELNKLKTQWKTKLAPNEKNKANLITGFEQFLRSEVGEFPWSDPSCWDRETLQKCYDRLSKDNGVEGVDDDIPFG